MLELSYKTIKLTRTPCYNSKRIITRGMHKNLIKKVADAVNKKTGVVTPSSTALKNHYKIKYDENMQKGQEGVPSQTNNVGEIATRPTQKIEDAEERKALILKEQDDYLSDLDNPIVSQTRSQVINDYKEAGETLTAKETSIYPAHPQIIHIELKEGGGSLSHSTPSEEMQNKFKFTLTEHIELETMNGDNQNFIIKLSHAKYDSTDVHHNINFYPDNGGINWPAINNLFNTPDKELNERNKARVRAVIHEHNLRLEEHREKVKKRISKNKFEEAKKKWHKKQENKKSTVEDIVENGNKNVFENDNKNDTDENL